MKVKAKHYTIEVTFNDWLYRITIRRAQGVETFLSRSYDRVEWFVNRIKFSASSYTGDDLRRIWSEYEDFSRDQPA